MPAPPPAIVQAIAASLRRELGVCIFGFDLITDRETGQHAVVDVNYFPGYKGFPQFHARMLELIEKMLVV